MNTGDRFIYTERKGNVKIEPHITQEKIYAVPYDFKLMSAYDRLIKDEKSKGKKTDKLKVKILDHYFNELIKGEDFNSYFTEGSIYLDYLNVYKSEKDFYGEEKVIKNLTKKQ